MQKQKEILLRSLRILLYAAFASCVLLTAVACFERQWWRAYLVAQFRIEIALVALIVALLLAFSSKSRRIAVASLLITVFNASYFSYVLVPRPASSAQPDTLRLLQMNLSNKNTDYDKVTAYIETVKPDILLVSELTDDWRRALEKIASNYKYSHLEPRLGTYGIGIYSAIELAEVESKYYGSSGHPSILCTVEKLKRPIHLMHTHVQGPTKKPWFDWHKEQWLEMQNQLSKVSPPLVVTGDMNSTPWTYLTSDFLNETKLEDSQRGFGLQVSWPAPFYFRNFPFVLLPIDNCYISNDLAVTKRETGPCVGSDHYPVIVEISISSSRNQ